MHSLLGGLYLAGAFILAGSSVVAARFVSGKLGIFTIAAVSLLLALLALLAASGYRFPNALRNISRRNIVLLLFQATCGIFFFRILLLNGLMYTSASEAGILTGATPALTTLLARLFLYESLSKARVVSIICTVSGILLIQGMLIPGNGLCQEHLIGNILILGAALCESLFNVLSRFGSLNSKLYPGQETDPLVQTTLVTGVALILCLGPAFTEQPAARLMALGSAEWLALLWYGLFVTALGYVLWYAGIKRCDASTAAVFSGMMPFTALLLSVALLGEQPGWQQWLGGLIVMLGMVLTGLNLSNPIFKSKDPPS